MCASNCDLTSKWKYLRPERKELYIYNYKDIFYLIPMLFFLVCWVLVGSSPCIIWFAERGRITSQNPGIFCWLIFLVGIDFQTKKQFNSAVDTFYCNCYPPPPQLNHEITCYHNYEVDEGEEAYQYKDWVGVFLEVKGRRDGEEDKGGKNQED